MKKKLSSNLSKNQQKPFSAWDAAIADAEQMMQEAKARAEDLEFSIHAFKQMRDSGELFPGTCPKIPQSAQKSEAESELLGKAQARALPKNP
jgi:hypothetical protein